MIEKSWCDLLVVHVAKCGLRLLFLNNVSRVRSIYQPYWFLVLFSSKGIQATYLQLLVTLIYLCIHGIVLFLCLIEKWKRLPMFSQLLNSHYFNRAQNYKPRLYDIGPPSQNKKRPTIWSRRKWETNQNLKGYMTCIQVKQHDKSVM